MPSRFVEISGKSRGFPLTSTWVILTSAQATWAIKQRPPTKTKNREFTGRKKRMLDSQSGIMMRTFRQILFES
jgi:hypothetical protein